mmetsp:Transcript_124353/g.398205  ORF Transcript_124353/g.398205 Transcript_124353/m.398205 type:complete len:204 (+) Transcript_124353:79-690(+)
MSDETSRVTSFEVPDLLQPLQKTLAGLCTRIAQERNDDPVPQFSLRQVKEVVDFLTSAVDGMQNDIDTFTPPKVQAMDDAKLNIYQEKVREAARRLVLIFGDGISKFAGELEKGTLSLRANAQNQQMKSRLQQLSQFLKTFRPVLGSLLPQDLQKTTQTTIALLDGLVNPQKLQPLPGRKLLRRSPVLPWASAYPKPFADNRS